MSVTYIDAIHQALDELLAEDPDVFLLGEDIAGTFGGAFKATKGLDAKYPGRVLNAPIAEDAIAGVGMGAALGGMKPIVEMQFADFGTLALNQAGNNAGAHFYRTGIPVNLTFRMPCGGTPGGGPYHSQSLEALFAHYPGLHVFTPATVADAYYMLKQAVQIPDPVIFLEHKFLYRWLKAETWADPNPLPIGQARIARPGQHATVVAFSAMVPEALRAADELAATSGYELEVVDLRSVKPLDIDTILDSVARTARLLVVSEDFPWGGVAAEVVAQVTAQGFHLLDAPPLRLSAHDTPIPAHPELWKAHRPGAAAIAEAARYLITL
ncbi:MAG: transketolase C-terminal domain-containing protein [Akkermansia sp.]|nr:alpha-ketoacid dehydrogenase subunit beta [Akkermansia sp.]MEE1266904.1 transketolase C-terminal domain-containing protein [Akkermansia sp.]